MLRNRKKHEKIAQNHPNFTQILRFHNVHNAFSAKKRMPTTHLFFTITPIFSPKTAQKHQEIAKNSPFFFLSILPNRYTLTLNPYILTLIPHAFAQLKPHF